MNNPFELLTEDKDEARVMQISSHVAMILAKTIASVGREQSAKLLGVSPSRVSRLVNKTGAGMSMNVMLMSLSKLGAVVESSPVRHDSDALTGFVINVSIPDSRPAQSEWVVRLAGAPWPPSFDQGELYELENYNGSKWKNWGGALARCDLAKVTRYRVSS